MNSHHPLPLSIDPSTAAQSERPEQPGGLHGQVWLSVQTLQAQRLIHGRQATSGKPTIVGLIPLAYGETGLASMRYFPMARTIMGGLIASTALTLVVLPTYYVLMDDLGRYVKGIWLSTGPRQAHAPADGD
jgi:hypothetical protein